MPRKNCLALVTCVNRYHDNQGNSWPVCSIKPKLEWRIRNLERESFVKLSRCVWQILQVKDAAVRNSLAARLASTGDEAPREMSNGALTQHTLNSKDLLHTRRSKEVIQSSMHGASDSNEQNGGGEKSLNGSPTLESTNVDITHSENHTILIPPRGFLSPSMKQSHDTSVLSIPRSSTSSYQKGHSSGSMRNRHDLRRGSVLAKMRSSLMNMGGRVSEYKEFINMTR